MILPVSETGVRPAGPQDSCFYCLQPLIDGVVDHTPECVIRKRTVVVALKVKMVIAVPEHWTAEDINFFYNESCHCADNEIERISEQLETNNGEWCFCHQTDMEYLRDATEDEHDEFHWDKREIAE